MVHQVRVPPRTRYTSIVCPERRISQWSFSVYSFPISQHDLVAAHGAQLIQGRRRRPNELPRRPAQQQPMLQLVAAPHAVTSRQRRGIRSPVGMKHRRHTTCSSTGFDRLDYGQGVSAIFDFATGINIFAIYSTACHTSVQHSLCTTASATAYTPAELVSFHLMLDMKTGLGTPNDVQINNRYAL